MAFSDCRPSLVSSSVWCEVAELVHAENWSAAIARLTELADQTGCCEVRLALGALHAEREEYHLAIRFFTEVIDGASRTGDRVSLAAAHSNLAAIYRDLGDYDLARRFQQRALQYQDDCGAEDLLHLANDALTSARWELADALLEAAAELVDADDPLQATILSTVGVAQSLQGYPRQAIEFLYEAYSRHLAERDNRAAGQDLLNFAAACRQLGRLRLEMRCLTRAGNHFEQAGAAQSREKALARKREVERLLAIQCLDPRAN